MTSRNDRLDIDSVRNPRRYRHDDSTRMSYRADPLRSSPFLSVVIPVLNEAENVKAMVERLRQALHDVTESYEVIFVSDGSTDETDRLVADANTRDPRFKLLCLSRPFGHQNAIQAGLDHAAGRTVVTMDGDLQHPPEAIPDMLNAWREGADVVHGIRQAMIDKSRLRRMGKRIGYGMLERLCDVDIVPQSADFRLYDRCAVEAMARMREQGRFNRGLARWIGFKQAIVHFTESKRNGGEAKYSTIRLIRLLTDGVFSLSAKPLRYMGMAGLMFSALSGCYLLFVLFGHIVGLPGFDKVNGWASLIATVLCMGGVQLVGLWLMGQYMGRTYDEVKQRPLYVVADTIGIPSRSALRLSAMKREIPKHAETTSEFEKRMEAIRQLRQTA
ncbi:MAG: glycosyltransferase family 2 protein [Phycisphaerales bacterium]|nr:glycosyltransferase family 2 protein [Phycisphaerales bacterium]MCB9863117.1 glycosyltransferase family 2 protein [Phycisphaerales bacterium]